MRLRDLPCISNLFLDFVENHPEVTPFLERLPGMDLLAVTASEARSRDVPRRQLVQILGSRFSDYPYGEAAARNLQRLASPDTVVILVCCPDSFAGGPLFQFLKFLTAAKLVLELESGGIGAVPVCWIEPGSSRLADCGYLLDSDGELRDVGSEVRPGANSPAAQNPVEGLAALLGPSVQPEIMESLRQCYAPGTDAMLATGRFVARMMQEWGFMILDGRDRELHELAVRVSGLDRVDPEEQSALLRRQAVALRASKYDEGEHEVGRDSHLSVPSMTSLLLESLLPVAARVVDQSEVRHLALLPALLSRLHLKMPRLWPRASATILDTRSSKILRKHGIRFRELFQGPDEVLRRLHRDSMAEEGRRSLEQLSSRIGTTFSEFQRSVPPGDRLAADIADADRRMEYQIGKLMERFATASSSKREVMNRQLKRVCNRLAPRACPQELMLAGLNFLARYSPVVLRTLFRELDIRSTEHQLIPVE